MGSKIGEWRSNQELGALLIVNRSLNESEMGHFRKAERKIGTRHLRFISDMYDLFFLIKRRKYSKFNVAK